MGCPRSGTSLVRDLLRSHENVTFAEESHFIPDFYRAYGDPADAPQAQRLAERILSFAWVRSWNLPLSPVEFRDCRTYRDVLSRLYEAWATREGKKRWGDKTPQYVTAIPVLVDIFPEAKILHVIRDGRDVAQSWVRTSFEPRNLYVAARLWKAAVSAGRAAGRALPPESYLEVCYENLLKKPEDTMKTVCRHLGEPYSEAVLRPTSIPDRWCATWVPGPNRQVSRERIVATNLHRWKTHMSSSQRALFESVAGDLLADLGYEVEGVGRTVSPLEKLFWSAHHTCLYWSRVGANARNRPLLSAGLSLRRARLRKLGL